MTEILSNTYVQNDTHVLALETAKMSLLSLPILNICRKIKETFPTLRFEWNNSQDKGVNFLIHDLGVYLSSEFEDFLETVANSLTDEEYMCIDFLPAEKENLIVAYNTTTKIDNSTIPEDSSRRQTETNKQYMIYDNESVQNTGDFSIDALAA